MYTACPHCQATFQLTQAHLDRWAGLDHLLAATMPDNKAKADLLRRDFGAVVQMKDNGESLLLPARSPAAETVYMQLAESRRMRSEELHYLDHPEFGMLVLITPVDSTQEAAV